MSSDNKPATAVQLDLFGEVEAHERETAAKAAERAAEAQAWHARFERAPWVAPWDTAGGMKKGESVLGYRCPDPDCGQVEINSHILSLNHGFDPLIAGRAPYDGRCHRLRRRHASTANPTTQGESR
jgi:hypothetical protein